MYSSKNVYRTTYIYSNLQLFHRNVWHSIRARTAMGEVEGPNPGRDKTFFNRPYWKVRWRDGHLDV